MNQSTEYIYAVKGIDGVRFSREGLARLSHGVMGGIDKMLDYRRINKLVAMEPSQRVATKVIEHAGNRTLPFGSFGCPRGELEHALHLGFEIDLDKVRSMRLGRMIYREDQGDGWTQLRAAGRTLAQVAELDSGLRWLAWLAWDGWMETPVTTFDRQPQKVPFDWTPRPNEVDELTAIFGLMQDGRPIDWMMGKENALFVRKKILLYGDFGRDVLAFMGTMREEYESLFEEMLVGSAGQPDPGTRREIQEAGFIPGDAVDHSVNRWFACREFLRGPGKAPEPKLATVIDDEGNRLTGLIQISRTQGDTWEKLKEGVLAQAIREAQEREIAPFVPVKLTTRVNGIEQPDFERAWTVAQSIVERYERIGKDEVPGEVELEDLSRVWQSAYDKAFAALKEVDDAAKLTTCEKSGSSRKWQGAIVEQRLNTLIVEARKQAVIRMERLPGWEKKRFESKPVHPGKILDAMQVLRPGTTMSLADWNRIAESKGTSPHVAKQKERADLAVEAMEELLADADAKSADAKVAANDLMAKRARRARVKAIRAARLLARDGGKQLIRGLKSRSMRVYRMVKRQQHALALTQANKVAAEAQEQQVEREMIAELLVN